MVTEGPVIYIECKISQDTDLAERKPILAKQVSMQPLRTNLYKSWRRVAAKPIPCRGRLFYPTSAGEHRPSTAVSLNPHRS